MLLCTEGLLEKPQELVLPWQTVSGYYTLWKIQYDTMKGISTTSETRTLQTAIYLPFSLWNTQVEQAFCFLFIDLFVLCSRVSVKLPICSLKTMASLSPVIQIVSKDQPTARELNGGLHKTPPVFLCLLGKQDAWGSASPHTPRAQPRQWRGAVVSDLPEPSTPLSPSDITELC